MAVSPSSPQPRLADHVRACRVGDQMIFLDLLRSRYFGAAGPQLAALSAAILQGSTVADAPPVRASLALPHDWIDRLRGQHLLSEAPSEGPARQLPRLIEPVSSLNADDESSAAASDWRHLVRLWRATLVTAAWLRRRSLADIANRVEALRTRHSERGQGIAADAMLAAVASYVRLRPFALTTHDRCLNDSLTLIHFLATEGLFPQWVIGVRVRPFGAHSWVQNGGVVLNDLAERVRHYQPILVV
jgi:Transglutaminase-like superfamily